MTRGESQATGPARRTTATPTGSRAPPGKWAALRARVRANWRQRWVRVAAISTALLVVASVAVVAGVLIRQDVSTSPSAATPDVIFKQGADYTAINTAGFATVTVGSSATSATFSLDGVPGAALTKLSDVIQIENQDLTQGYTATLKRSAAPDAAITEFTILVQDSLDATVVSWDAAAGAASSSFSLPAATTYDITVTVVISDGTAAGALGNFDLQLELVPA